MAEKIILIEPDARLRGQMASFFVSRDYIVSEAGSVGEALAALTHFKPSVALVNTPLDEDAATVAFAVRQSPQVALVVMGQPAALDEFRLAVGFEVRPQAFLEKPFTAKQLATQVDAALRALREAAQSKEEAREASARLGDEVGALAEALAQLARKRPSAENSAGSAAPAPAPDPSEPVISAAPGVALPEVDAGRPAEDRSILKPMAPADPHDPRGIYGAITMAELFYNCFRDLYSGRLLLKRGEVWKSVRLMSGRPVQAASNVLSENLGALLVAAGRITPEQSERSIALAREGAGRQGEILVRMGLLTREALRAALRDQVRTRIVACFQWTDAEYGLGYEPGGAEVEDSEVNPLALIFEGVHTGAPIEPLVRHYDGALRRFVVTTPRFADYQALLRDRPQAAEIAALCDGNRVLAEVLGESSLTFTDTLRVVRALEVMQCVALGEARPLASSSTAPRRVRPVGSPSGDLARPAWPPSTGSVDTMPRRFTSVPIEARPPPPSSPPLARRDTVSVAPPARPTGDLVRPPATTSSGFHRSAPRPTSTGAPVVRPSEPSGSFRAVPRTALAPAPASQPPERPSVAGMRPPLPRTPSRSSQDTLVPADAPTPAALLLQEIERIEKSENLYEVMGLEISVSLRAVRDQSQRLLRLLNADQVARLDEGLLDRARQAARRVAEATETLGSRPLRESYEALHMPLPTGRVGVDLLAAESSFNKGQVCSQYGLLEKAQRFFTLAVEQDPHQALYRVFLAHATYVQAPADDKRARGKALDEAREALESVSGRDDAWMLAADMALGLANPDLAVRLYNKALDINSGNARAREALTAIERGDNKTPETRGGGLLNKLFSRR
jgi:FixJ family two-component response regulator